MQANEDELNSRHSHLPTVLQVGHDLIKADNFGSEKIQNRIDNIEEQWKNLLELANFRRRRLMEAVDFYQVSLGFEISLICLVRYVVNLVYQQFEVSTSWSFLGLQID